MIELTIDIFDPDSIAKAIQRVDELKDKVQEKSNDAVKEIAEASLEYIKLYSPDGWSGDYINAHHIDIDGDTALIWNDVRAKTPYDDKLYNPLGLRTSSRSGWVGESYASAVEYGYEAGWPLWKNSPLSNGYRPYEKGTKTALETIVPTVKAEFTLD